MYSPYSVFYLHFSFNFQITHLISESTLLCTECIFWKTRSQYWKSAKSGAGRENPWKFRKKPAGDDPDKRGRKEQIPFNFPLQIGDPKLREISKRVENFDDLGKIVEEMKTVSRKYDALGLAAPQIGVHQVITS